MGRKFKKIYFLVLVYIFFGGIVFGFEPHCKTIYGENGMGNECVVTENTILGGQVQCANDPVKICNTGIPCDNNRIPTRYNNSYFASDVPEKDDYKDFLRIYDLFYPDSSLLSFVEVRGLQEDINNISHVGGFLSLENKGNIFEGECKYVCEDGKIGNGTLLDIANCLLKCNDETRFPEYNGDTLTCFGEDLLKNPDLVDGQGCCVVPEISCDKLGPDPLKKLDNSQGCCFDLKDDNINILNQYCIGLDNFTIADYSKSFLEKGCELCQAKWNGTAMIRPISSLCLDNDKKEIFPFCNEYPNCKSPFRNIDVNDIDKGCCIDWNENNTKLCEGLEEEEFDKLSENDFLAGCKVCKIGINGQRLSSCDGENLKEVVPFCGNFPEKILSCEEPLVNKFGITKVVDLTEDCCVERKLESVKQCIGFEDISNIDTFDFSQFCNLYDLNDSYQRVVDSGKIKQYQFCPADCGSVAINFGSDNYCCVKFDNISLCDNYEDFDGLKYEDVKKEDLMCDVFDDNNLNSYYICDNTQIPESEDESVSKCSLITQQMLDDCTCGIKLNTIVPFIGDCIQFGGNIEKGARSKNTFVVGPNTAFPILMAGLSKIVVTLILVFSFLLVVVAGVIMTIGGVNEQNFSKGTQLIMKVVAGLALLGTIGIILKLINPSFFG